MKIFLVSSHHCLEYESDGATQQMWMPKKPSAQNSTVDTHHLCQDYSHFYALMVLYNSFARCVMTLIYVLLTGICYGFQVMRFLESPNTPFTIIYERFPEGSYAFV